jgi:uncharacterized protein (DUF342 family)
MAIITKSPPLRGKSSINWVSSSTHATHKHSSPKLFFRRKKTSPHQFKPINSSNPSKTHSFCQKCNLLEEKYYFSISAHSIHTYITQALPEKYNPKASKSEILSARLREKVHEEINQFHPVPLGSEIIRVYKSYCERE